MFGANPLFGNSQMGGMNPFGMSPANQSPSSGNGGFNVDDLVKRIDAKIAELEEEERREKESQEKQKEQMMPTNKEIIENNKLEQTSIPKSTMIDDIDNEKTEKINLNELSTNKATNMANKIRSLIS